MNKLNLLIVLFFIFLQNFSLVSQSMSNSSNEVDVYDLYMMSKNNTSSKLNIEGSIYLDNSFKQGDIYFTSNKDLVDVPIRLDLLNHAIEVRKTNDILFVANLDKVKYVEIDNEKYILKNVDNEGLVFFLLEEENGLVEILRRKNVVFKEGKKSTNSYSDDQLPSYQNEKEIRFISFDNSKLISLDSNRKFKNDLKESQLGYLYEFYKKEKLKVTRRADLLKLINYFNSRNEN